VLERFADRAFLDIELKVAGLERITVKLLKQYQCTRGCIVSSFLSDVVREAQAKNGDVPLGLICSTRKQVASATSLPLAVIVLHASLVNLELISSFRDRGIAVFAWGANRAKEMRSIVEAGSNALIVDDTQLAFETFRGQVLAAGNP
jgi:hypothetical protein